MPECQLVHQSERRTTKDRNLAAGLQRTTSAQFVKLLAAGRVCTDSSGDEGMSKASTELLEQGTQTPSPAPDLIPAQTENQPRTHIGIGTANGGTSGGRDGYRVLRQFADQLRGQFRHRQNIAPVVVDVFLGNHTVSDCLLFSMFYAKRFAGSFQRIPFVG